MTTPSPLTETSAVKPPAGVLKPMVQLLISYAIVSAFLLFWPALLPYAFAACLSYDLMLMASYLAVLTKWAKAVHALLEQAHAAAPRP